MASRKDLAAAVVENYLEFYDDYYDALGNFVDDINTYLKSKPHCTEQNELLLVADILEEVEKLNEALGVDPK